MFGKDEERPKEPTSADLPPTRLWKVIYIDPETGSHPVQGVIEETVPAHSCNLSSNGTLYFLTYQVFDGQPIGLVSRAFNVHIWKDVKDVTPVAGQIIH